MNVPRLGFLLLWFTACTAVASPGESGHAGAPAPLGVQAASGETKEQLDARMAWWREARFGMFIHWGIMSIPGRECWYMHEARVTVDEYEKLVSRYNPTNYSAKDIVSLAKAAGQKYLVFVSKHHDGFAMWDTRLSEYSIMATPFKRDIVKELADECGRQGMKFGLYYSILDWHHPYARWQHWPKYREYMKGQLRELLTGYGPIAVLWFDGEWAEEWTDQQGRELYAYVRSLQPNIIINNRIGKGRQDNLGQTKQGFFPGDFDTPEQQVPRKGWPGTDWESCMTINGSWSFTTNDTQHKPARELVQMLADIASKGGNFLLNIGPRPDGSIMEDQRDRLMAIGRWMKVNKESIYWTTAGPFARRLAWGRCTAGPGRLYLHVFDWPGDRQLTLPGLKNAVGKAWLLSDPARASLPVSRSQGMMTIELPAAAPDPFDGVVVLDVEGRPDVEPSLIRPASDGVISLLAASADLHGGTVRYDSLPERDSIGHWTDAGDWVSWDFVVNCPGEYRVELAYGCETGSGGGELLVEVGEQRLTVKAQETGGWFQRVTCEVGTLDLKGTGPHTVALRIKSKPGVAVLDLHRVTLKPKKS